MYDVILVSPPSRAINHYRPPLGLMYVAQWYKEQGKSVKIIDPKIKDVIRDKSFFANRDKLVREVEDGLVRELHNVEYDILGISCYSPEYEEVRNLINRVKKTKIIVGGIHPTLKAEDFDGIAEVFKGKVDSRLPAYDCVDMSYYLTPNPYCIRGIFIRATYVLSSMGCPGHCSFCVASKLREHYGCGYIKTPKELKDEIAYLKKNWQIDGFYLIDDLFTYKRDFVQDFCDYIQPLFLAWGCSSRITTLCKETIRTMAKAGCRQIDFGVERGSNESLRRVKKGQRVEQIREVFAYCKESKIRTFANFIVNIPGETTKDLRDIKTLIRDIQPTITSINVFRGYLGTELKDQKPKESLERWATILTKRSNSIFKSLRLGYWGFLCSRNRGKYFRELLNLIKEIINQKWGVC